MHPTIELRHHQIGLHKQTLVIFITRLFITRIFITRMFLTRIFSMRRNFAKFRTPRATLCLTSFFFHKSTNPKWKRSNVYTVTTTEKRSCPCRRGHDCYCDAIVLVKTCALAIVTDGDKYPFTHPLYPFPHPLFHSTHSLSIIARIRSSILRVRSIISRIRSIISCIRSIISCIRSIISRVRSVI